MFGAPDSAASPVKDSFVDPLKRTRLRGQFNASPSDKSAPKFDDDLRIELEPVIEETKYESARRQSLIQPIPFVVPDKGNKTAQKQKNDKNPAHGRPRSPASGNRIKKRKTGKKYADMPPTPYGCEWRRTDDGWTLWRCWSEKDQQSVTRIKKSRFVGYMSREAWNVLKEYDNETFISIIGERFRRYGKR